MKKTLASLRGRNYVTRGLPLSFIEYLKFKKSICRHSTGYICTSFLSQQIRNKSAEKYDSFAL